MNLKFIIFILIILFSYQISAQQKQKRPTVGLVLSGGGAKGIAHIGVLKILEKEGIKVDYITGTSMGSLVGGLYSIGYSADELEKIILSQDWQNLLTDKIDRKFKSIDDRKFDEKYLLSFPLEIKTGISLPKGAVSGQKVSNLFTQLTIPVHDVGDFTKFPIPFKCIATDIETGEAVVLSKGFLAEAMRASMSLPTVYTPVEINGRLLLDGGLVRNLPVSDMKEFNPDIIITVDVNDMLQKKENLKDITAISEQTITIMMLKENNRQRSMSDVIISPDMTDMNTASFLKAEELIKRGENAALIHIDEIKKLTGSGYYDEINQTLEVDKLNKYVKIDKIVIKGLKNHSDKFIRKKLNLKIKNSIEYDDIDAAIERIYGIGSFERVTYIIAKDQNDDNVLIVNANEKGINSFNVGLRYDTEQNASLLLNLTFKNWVIKDSISIFEAKLGDNPKYTLSYLTPIGFLYFFSVEENYWHNEFDLHIYEADEKIIDYRCNVDTYNLNLKSFFFYNFLFGVGGEFEHVMLDVDISKLPQDKDITHSYFLNYYFFYEFDSMDEKYFPKSGLKFYGEYKSVSPVNDNDRFIDYNSAYRIKIEMETAFSIYKVISFQNNFRLGAVRGRYVPQQYYFFIGGLNEIEGRVYPFYGLKYMQKYCNYFQMYEGAIQLNLFKHFYLTPRINAVRIQYDVDEIRDDNYSEIIYGYAASAGAKTPIGPIEITGSTNNKFKESNFSFYFGYEFN